MEVRENEVLHWKNSRYLTILNSSILFSNTIFLICDKSFRKYFLIWGKLLVSILNY